VDVIVHTTLSPTAIVDTAAARMPPVLLVQSTNPMSEAVDPPQGGAVSPILTAKFAAMAKEAPINAVRLSTNNPIKEYFFPLILTSN